MQAALVFVPDIVRARWNKGWFVSIYLLSALFLGFLDLSHNHFLTPYKSAEPVARAIKKWIPADEEIYEYRIALYGVDFYDKIRTPIVEDFGELGFGIRQLCPGERAHYFLSAAQFYGLCKQRESVYCITQYRERLEALKKELPNFDILWDNGAFFLLRINARPSGP